MAVLVVAAAALGAVIVVSAADETETCKEFHFNREDWLQSGAGDGQGTKEQTEIADRLVECALLLGKRASSVRRMLGPPDEQFRRKRTTWHYELGPERSAFSIDSEFLDIKFGRHGKVTSAEVYSG